LARRVVEVLDLDLGFNAIVEDMAQASRKEVLVGIQEGAKTHTQVKGDRKQKSGVTIAQYAAYNEFGTETIPERSFMRSTFDQNLEKIEDILIIQLGLVVDRERTLTQAFNRVGLAVGGMVQMKIREIRTPPNSPYTIAEKKSSKPLIDFGQMIAAVRHVVRNSRGSQ
jgi:HK97 gp10 family phage protein